jgi:hypothetical protein
MKYFSDDASQFGLERALGAPCSPAQTSECGYTTLPSLQPYGKTGSPHDSVLAGYDRTAASWREP